MVVSKINFRGGMNQLADITKMGPDEYWLLINGRTRANGVEAVYLPSDVTDDLFDGATIQDISGAGDKLVAFKGGNAYSRTPSTNWSLISSFNMGSTKDRVYTEIIPGSRINYQRAVSAVYQGTLTLSGLIGGSPAAMIVMDGEKQPWIILPDGTSRVTRNYLQWNKSDAEYVPIGNYPMFYNGKLYCVIADKAGRKNQIAHSCTGQPLNYMIAVTPNGERTSALEAEGGAGAVAHDIGYNEITCLSTTNSVDGAFFASSAKNCALVFPDNINTLYAEPQFSNQIISASIGALNQNSFIDLLGDGAFVHDSGIRSFNGIMQFRYEGRNSPLSAPINSLLNGIAQTSSATGSNDNYILFAVNTIYGYGILFYDTLTEQWASLDIYPGVGEIRKFTNVVVDGVFYTYFMTDTRIYQLYGSNERATCTVYGNEVVAGSDYQTVQLSTARFDFDNVVEGGYCAADLFVDGQLCNSKVTNVAPAATNVGNTVSVPYNTPITEGAVGKCVFNFEDNSAIGVRAGVMLRFNTDGRLILAAANLQEGERVLFEPQNTVSVPQEVFAIVGDDGVGPSGFTPTEYANRVIINNAIQRIPNLTAVIGTGDHAYESGTEAQVNANMLPFWSNVKPKLVFVPGNHDNDTNAGEAFFNGLNYQRTGRVTETENVEIFQVNDGLNSALVQTEIQNAGPVLSESPQFLQLRERLIASRAKHKWVTWHHPPVCSDALYYPGVAQMQEAALKLKEWGATALFCGHSHIVERLNYNGLLVIISGAGGRDYRALHDPVSEFSNFARGNIGAYWEVYVTPLTAYYVCKDLNGNVLDQYIQPV